MSLCCKYPRIHIEYEFWGLWSAHCSNCYDGAPDSPNRNEVGDGKTAKEALLDWVEQVEFNQDEHSSQDCDHDDTPAKPYNRIDSGI